MGNEDFVPNTCQFFKISASEELDRMENAPLDRNSRKNFLYARIKPGGKIDGQEGNRF